MKILIVARCKHEQYAPFIIEQVDALEKQGMQCQYFGIHDKGLLGYIKHIQSFKRVISDFKPDIIHAHYGLCGLFANIQRQIPVVTTYHGSDINLFLPRCLSRLAIMLSALNIFVSQKCIDRVHPHNNYTLLPCGVSLENFPNITQKDAREQIGLKGNTKYILFAGSFDNSIKNPSLAIASAKLVEGANLLELKGYSRSEVALLMQAVDVLLMTSHSEGSPQVIKEALAYGCPIVSVDVGDVSGLIKDVDGCYIAHPNPKSIANCLKKAIAFGKRTSGQTIIVKYQLSNELIAKKLIQCYNGLL